MALDVDALAAEFGAVDSSLVTAIALEYEDESEARQLLEQLNSDALQAAVDWTDFDGITHEISRIETQEALDRRRRRSLTDEEGLEGDIKFLRQSFPGVPVAILRLNLKTCDGDVERATDLLLNRELVKSEVDVDEAAAQSSMLAKRKGKKGKARGEEEIGIDHAEVQLLAKTLSLPAEQALKLYEQNGRSLAKCLFVHSKAAEARIPSGSVLNAPLPTVHYDGNKRELENMAQTSFQLRQQAIQQAQAMYRKSRSSPLYRSAAGHYASLAAEHGTSAREALNSMHRNMVEDSSSRYVIDFHGVPLHIALETCQVKLQQWVAGEELEGRYAGQMHPLKIITGSGRHSDGGVPKIKNGIRKILLQSWSYVEDGPFFLVRKPKVG